MLSGSDTVKDVSSQTTPLTGSVGVNVKEAVYAVFAANLLPVNAGSQVISPTVALSAAKVDDGLPFFTGCAIVPVKLISGRP